MNSPQWIAKQLHRNFKLAKAKHAKAKHTRRLSQKVHAILRETWNGKVTFAVSRKRDAKSH